MFLPPRRPQAPNRLLGEGLRRHLRDRLLEARGVTAAVAEIPRGGRVRERPGASGSVRVGAPLTRTTRSGVPNPGCRMQRW